MSYEAFGKRRSGDWRAASAISTGLVLPKFTNRGYTGHEHVDEMGLIHMNGRVYDPELGRFLSADPNIQAPHNTQSYNRYAYVMNNPLKYTDPSGYFWKKLKESVKKNWTKIRGTIKVVAGAAAMVVASGMTAASGGALAPLGSVLFAVGIGLVESGFADLNGYPSSNVTPVSIPVASFSAGGSGGGTYGYNRPQSNQRYEVSATSGGTSSSVGVGKFANGATTAAFGYLFSGGGVRQQQASGSSGGGFFNGVLDVVGKIWALPNTIAGLVYGGAGHVAGWIMGTNPQIEFGHNAIQFINNPFIRDNEALTLGNTILYGSNSPPWKPGAYGDNSVNIGFHEEAHTYQYQALGPFYAPVYLLNGGFSGPARNPLEQAAQVYGRNRGQGGWWPW